MRFTRTPRSRNPYTRSEALPITPPTKNGRAPFLYLMPYAAPKPTPAAHNRYWERRLVLWNKQNKKIIALLSYSIVRSIYEEGPRHADITVTAVRPWQLFPDGHWNIVKD
eukprot:scaffold4157_cov58-Attheya_sp.AAC.5